jgi:ribosomal protein L22
MAKKTKNKAAVALAELSRRKRMRDLTPEQRSAQGKKAVASRRDRQKSTRWYGLIALPADYVWKGAAHASKVLDAATANSAEVLFWSQDRAKVNARAQQKDLRDRDTLIIEQDWNPNAFTLQREYKPDADALQRMLRVGGRQ